MRRSPLLCATFLALVLLGIGPSTASAVTAAKGTITAVPGQANTYVLTVENTGNEAIQCMRFFAASGVTITGVSPPAQQESASVFSAGPTLNITPGNSSNFTFTTQAPYPTDGGGALNVSSTCATGSDVSAPVTGPAGGAGGPPPPPVDPRCKCTGLTATLGKPSIRALHGRFLGFKLKWKLKCSAGDGDNCRGKIKVKTFPKDVTFTSPRDKVVDCVGRCARTTRRRSDLEMLFSERLRPLADAPASRLRRHKKPYPKLRIGLDFFCLDADGVEKLVGRRVMTVKFDRLGQVDKRASDLDGDGDPDKPRRRGRPR